MTTTVKIENRENVNELLKRFALYDMKGAARITHYNVRYLRRLCHNKKVDHQRILGRYYMTAEDVAKLICPVAKEEK